MALQNRPTAARKPGAGRTRVIAGLTATLLLGACADTGDMLPKPQATLAQDDGDAETKSNVPQTELQKATTYWGKEYAKRTSDLKPALNYARNLKALGEKNKALAVLQQASSLHDGDPELAGEYGRLALEMDQVNVAARMLQVADDPAKPDWRVISARGTVFAKQGQYKEAIPFYERALTLAQDQPSLLNNLAMAYAMSGDAKKAETLLRQASAGNAGLNNGKVKQNLALVLGLEGRYDEAKSVTAGTEVAATSSENVDMLRSIVKVQPGAAPTALAGGAVPDFKTKVSKAIATAATQPVANASDAYVPPPRQPFAPVFKAAATDTPAAEGNGWQTSAAKTAAAAPAVASNSLFKGSSQ
jgi:Flp pilus assembly protein TadD